MGRGLFTVYSWNLFGLAGSGLVGNNAPMVLLFVAGFIAAQLANRSAAAGALLGIAIAVKVWPATLLVPLARERNWRTIAWAVGVAATTTAVLLLWLGGPTVIRPLLRALTLRDELGPYEAAVGIAWLRERTDWWPDWGGYAVCALMLLIPAKGLTGYGRIFAGMAAIRISGGTITGQSSCPRDHGPRPDRSTPGAPAGSDGAIPWAGTPPADS